MILLHTPHRAPSGKEVLMHAHRLILTAALVSLALACGPGRAQSQERGEGRINSPVRDALPLVTPPPQFAPPPPHFLPGPPLLPLDPAMPKLIPAPSPELARLAAESNYYGPACEPPGPTKGLWGEAGPPFWPHSWQECWMSVRDCMTWLFTTPTCCCGARPAPNASAFAWATQWLPYWGSSQPCAGCTACGGGNVKAPR
jgi:hypothetical protein